MGLERGAAFARRAGRDARLAQPVTAMMLDVVLFIIGVVLALAGGTLVRYATSPDFAGYGIIVAALGALMVLVSVLLCLPAHARDAGQWDNTDTETDRKSVV